MRKTITMVTLVWNVIGFMTGLVSTVIERDSGHYENNGFGGLMWVSDGLSGCVYRSASSFTNPGYIASCELFRKRFAYEGVAKAFGK